MIKGRQQRDTWEKSCCVEGGGVRNGSSHVSGVGENLTN